MKFRLTRNAVGTKEREKLDLEIESLRKKNRRDFIRLITTIVAVTGLLLGVAKFLLDQQKERTARAADQRLRFQNQMRNDVDEILKFPKDKIVSRVAFLLEDLSITLDSRLPNGRSVSSEFPHYKRDSTKKMFYLINYDSDYPWDRKDVDLASVVLEHWPDYGAFLKEDLTKLNSVLYNHIRALRYLRDYNPGYFESMKYHEKTDEYEVGPKYEKQKGEEGRFQHFEDIRDGFLEHLRLIANDSRPEAKEMTESNRQQFEGALCNRKIAKQIFGAKFSNEPCHD